MRIRTLIPIALMAGCSSGAATDLAVRAATSTKGVEAPSSAATKAAPSMRIAETAAPTVYDGRAHAIVEITHPDVRDRALVRVEHGLSALEGTTHAVLDTVKAHLGIVSAQAETRAVSHERDELGMTHVRMEQVVSGVPVLGGVLMAHYDAAGKVRSVDSFYVRGVSGVSTTPALSADQARSVGFADALTTRADRDASALAEIGVTRLVVFAPEGGAAHLAYETSVRATHGALMNFHYVIDAQTGAILDRYDNLQSVQATSVGVTGDAQTFQVTANGNAYSMTDSTRTPNGIVTNTANNGTTLPGTLVTSNSLTQWDPAAVDAHAFAGAVYDFYKSTLQRNGIDGNNAQIISTVHYQQNYNNAFWDGTQMVYGDGDGQLFRSLSGGFDVVAHELTHGVTGSTSNLTYQGQTGALNEAVSDIFGCIIEHAVKPDPVKNWTLGETITVSQPALRSMIHPKTYQQPSNMSEYVQTTQDNGGVHTNSGVANNAMYLMTMGGTNDASKTVVSQGIGWDKAAQLWYRTNAHYLTSASDFPAAARANAQAATDLGFTQNEQNIVACAWIATGVTQGTCATLTAEPTPGAPDAGAPTDPSRGGGTSPTGTPGAPAPGTTGGNSGGTGSGTGGTAGTSQATTAGSQPGSGTSTAGQAGTAQPASDTSALSTDTGSGCSAAPVSSSRTPGLGGVLLALGAVFAARRRRGARA